MRLIRQDFDLKTEKRAGAVSHVIEHDGKQRNRHLLSRGNQRVILPFIRVFRRAVSQIDQPVRFSRHGRENDNHVMPRLFFTNRLARHIFDLFNVRHGCSAEFLNHQPHKFKPP